MITRPSNLSLSNCIGYYLELCQAKCQSENTIKGKSSILLMFKHWCSKHEIYDLRDISIDILESYQQFLNLYRSDKGNKPLSRATIRARLNTVTVFLRQMYLKEIISNNDFDKFQLPSLGRILPKPVVTESEVERIFNQTNVRTLKGIRDRAILETYYATGIRRAELGNLIIDDIDFEQRVVRVTQGKGYKDRYVPCSYRACFWIYRYLKTVRPQLANELSGEYLFLSNKGKQHRPAQLSETVAKYIKLANVRKTGACKQFRHGAATHMVDRGANIRHVQAFLGHADISTTQIYVHVSVAKLQEVYEQSHPSAIDLINCASSDLY